MKTVLSIIIVNYHTEKEILECLNSIIKSRIKLPFEIIIVDNNESDMFRAKLNNKFPAAHYIKTNKNIGYGPANNIGARGAKGKYLFFLNPDTIVYQNAVTILLETLRTKKDIGIVAPLLLDKNKKTYSLQGTRQLGVKEGIVILSFINKLFPNNHIFKNYWMQDWSKKKNIEVDVIPGTAFLIRKHIFEEVGGFDEQFFLFFEESDLCKRVRERGYIIMMIPDAKVIHIWGSSTKKQKPSFVNQKYQKSRLYYFKKHYGILPAYTVQIVSGLNLNSLFLFIILSISSFLLTHRLSDLMMFIGDQGWFYLSARDMLQGRGIPLVGIPSSVVWIHQGALTTYAIAISFLLGNYHPAAPAYMFALLSIATTYLVYYLGRQYFNEQIGLLSAAFYATSPLIIVSGRMPYHTAPIPFFVCVFFIFLYKFLKGERKYLYFCAFTLGILYQLELSNSILFAVILTILIFYKHLVDKKLLALSGFCLLIALTPFVLYDITHKFVQTAGFGLWALNRIRLFFGLSLQGQTTISNLPSALHTMWQEIQRIIFPENPIIALFVIVLIVSITILHAKNVIDKKNPGFLLLMLWLGMSFVGFIVHAAPGVAYFPLIYPALCILIGFSFYYLFKKNPYVLVPFLFIIIFNALYIVSHNYFLILGDSIRIIKPGMFSLGTSLSLQVEIANKIVSDANNNSFALKGGGFLAVQKSSIDNYKYLVWYKGGKLKDSANLKYIIYPGDAYNVGGSIFFKDRSVIITKSETYE